MNCYIIIKENTQICIRCRRLGDILRMREKRKQHGAQERLLLSPSKQRKIKKIKNQNKGLRKKIIYANKKVNRL